MKRTSIKHLTFAHQACLRGLEFYEIELRFLQERLEEIAADNTSREVAEQVEHFQNQFIIHQAQIDNLKHRVKESLDKLATDIKLSENFIREATVTEADKIAADYQDEENMFNEMRRFFNRFAAQWM
jgi:uncharacterized protein YydD (DUF2326 family)